MALTITSEDQRRRRAEHILPRHSVVYHAGVVANICGLHFRDVQTPRFLRDKAATVLLDKMWVFIEDPRKRQLYNRSSKWFKLRVSTVTCSGHK